MKQLIEFFPIVLFFIAYKLYDIYIATATIIAATFVQVIVYWLVYRKIEKMHWITLLLIVVMGGATLYLRDEQFIKWKLTIVECLFGAALLFSQFFGPKTLTERIWGGLLASMGDGMIDAPASLWKRLNLIWAGLFFGIGLLNVYVMNHFSTDDWVSFKTFGVPALMMIFSIGQIAMLYKYLPETEAKK